MHRPFGTENYIVKHGGDIRRVMWRLCLASCEERLYLFIYLTCFKSLLYWSINKYFLRLCSHVKSINRFAARLINAILTGYISNILERNCVVMQQNKSAEIRRICVLFKAHLTRSPKLAGLASASVKRCLQALLSRHNSYVPLASCFIHCPCTLMAFRKKDS